MSSLDRNSAHSCESTALASLTDTSGRSDNPPVLVQHAEQGTLPSTENILPTHGVLAWNPAHVQLEKNRVGEPSLFSEEKCLSLHLPILSEERKVEMGDPIQWHASPVLKAGAPATGY